MGLFTWLFGDASDGDALDAFDASGPVIIVAEGAGEIVQALTADRRTSEVLPSGDPALVERITAARPAVVVVAIELPSPSPNGFLVLKNIKHAAALRNVPTVLFSAEVTQDVLDQHAKLRGRADAYVTSTAASAVKQAIDGVAPRPAR